MGLIGEVDAHIDTAARAMVEYGLLDAHTLKADSVDGALAQLTPGLRYRKRTR